MHKIFDGFIHLMVGWIFLLKMLDVKNMVLGPISPLENLWQPSWISQVSNTGLRNTWIKNMSFAKVVQKAD